MSRPRPDLLATLLFLALSPLTAPALAEDEGPWLLRAGATWLEADAAFEAVVFNFAQIRGETSGAFGLGLGLEYRVTPRLGIELGVLSAEPDVDTTPIGVLIEIFPPPIVLVEPTSLRVTPVTVGLNVHLTPDQPVDVYLGPLLAWVSYGDLEVTGSVVNVNDLILVAPTTVDLGLDDDFTFGAKLGADVRAGDGPWTVSGALTYIPTSFSVQNVPVPVPSVDLDAIFVSLGVGYRF